MNWDKDNNSHSSFYATVCNGWVEAGTGEEDNCEDGDATEAGLGSLAPCLHVTQLSGEKR